MKKRILKKTEVFREGYIKGLQEARRIINETLDDEPNWPLSYDGFDTEHTQYVEELDKACDLMQRCRCQGISLESALYMVQQRYDIDAKDERLLKDVYNIMSEDDVAFWRREWGIR